MTAEHLLFIPFVFLAGFASGVMLTPYAKALGKKWQPKDDISALGEVASTRFSGRFALGALAAFIMVFVGTHLVELPYTMVALREITGGLPLFDQKPSFSAEDVYNRLTQFGPQARRIYLSFVYTADLVFPLSFLVFLTSFAGFVGERVAISPRFRNLMLVLPFIWFILDMLENSMTFALVAQFPRPTNVIGGLIGYVTVAKFSFLAITLLVPPVVLALFRRPKIVVL